jgi:hypothetical protein
VRRSHEEVFEVEAGAAKKCRVGVKEKGEAQGLSARFRKQRLGIGPFAEQVPANELWGGDDLALQPLVIRQLPYERCDRACVCRTCGADCVACYRVLPGAGSAPSSGPRTLEKTISPSSQPA